MSEIELRKQIVSKQPRVALRAKHCVGSSVVDSRLTMLDLLPEGLRCIEVGVAEGGFSIEILNRMKPSCLHLVDLWDGDRYGPDYGVVETRFSSQIESGLVSLHIAKSVDYLKTCQTNSFDFIYIDTDHTYHTTFAELCAASKVISTEGFIAGHDYTVGNIVTPVVYGVIEAVSKFCVEYDYRIKYLTAEPAGWNSFCLVKL